MRRLPLHAMVPHMQEQTKQEAPDYLRSAEVMELARISRRTLDRWTADGILPVIKRPGMQRRYRRDAVERLLAGEPP